MGSVVRQIVDKVVVGRDRVEIHLRAEAEEGIGRNRTRYHRKSFRQL